MIILYSVFVNFVIFVSFLIDDNYLIDLKRVIVEDVTTLHAKATELTLDLCSKNENNEFRCVDGPMGYTGSHLKSVRC